jgi:flagellar biosynthesis protein FlhG
MLFEYAEDGRTRYQKSSVSENTQEKAQPENASDIKNDATGTEMADKTILAVGGSKGGVGKSALAANLAVGLSLLGQQVVLADLDLGGADVHLYAGVKSLSKTWNDFLERKVDCIKDIMTPTPFKGLSLIGGDSSKLGSENLPYSQKQKIMRHLRELEGDYLIMDLGGNSSYNVLDFFLFADHKIVVIGTEPASVLDSYSFVKVSFYRFLDRFFSEHKSLKGLARQVKDGTLEKSKNLSMDSILEQVRERDVFAYKKLKQQYDEFHVSLVVNMADSHKDFRIADSMQQVLKEKCFLDVGVLGIIPFDKLARKAARSFTPIIVENPRSQPSKAIHQMLASILFDREKGSSRSELLEKTSLIRGKAKDRISSDTMTLDGLTVSQINSIYDQSPKLRQSFRKILDIIKT